MSRKVNPFGKTRDKEKPYAIYKSGNWEIRVLKTYKHPDNEKSQYDRWYVVARSDYTFGSWEYGDQYKSEIKGYFPLVLADESWLEYYKW